MSRSEAFPAQLDQVLGYLDGDAASRDAWSSSVLAIPTGVAPPDLWLLDSSGLGTAFAAERVLTFAFAHRLNPHDAVEMLRAYRARFRTSAYRAMPAAILAVSVICA